MTKENIIKLDKLDKEILYELDINCRQPYSQIGKKINKSKQFVEYRIKKLEENKVIIGYNTIVDLSRLGFIAVRVYLKFQNLTPQKEKELLEDLANDKKNWWMVTLEGNWDVGYAVAVKHIYEFYSYWESVQSRYNKYIKDKSIEIYSHINKYPHSYLIEKENYKKPLTLFSSTSKIEIDELDWKIIDIIGTNAKISIVELSNKLEINYQTIILRLKKLEEKKIILGYSVNINFLKFGYRYYKAYFSYYDFKDVKKFENLYCTNHPNILNTNKVIGRNDFEVEIQVKNFDQFENILNDIRTKFPKLIANYETIVAKDEIKYQFLPN